MNVALRNVIWTAMLVLPGFLPLLPVFGVDMARAEEPVAREDADPARLFRF